MPPVLSLVCIRILTPIPSAISSLCRSVRVVFIMTRNELVDGTDEYRIAGLAMKVRNELGFCMLESVYERALAWELTRAGFTAERQVPVLVHYDHMQISHGYMADIVVNDRIILELKAVSRLYAVHRRQLQFYLSASGLKSGLLINFGNVHKLECERFERKETRDYLGMLGKSTIPSIPEEEIQESGVSSLSLSERVSQVLGGDA